MEIVDDFAEPMHADSDVRTSVWTDPRLIVAEAGASVGDCFLLGNQRGKFEN